MKTIKDILENNILLYNTIKKKFWNNYEIKLLKDNDMYYIVTYDKKQFINTYTSQKVKEKDLIILNFAIEKLIENNLFHLKEIIEKHIKEYEKQGIINILWF